MITTDALADLDDDELLDLLSRVQGELDRRTVLGATAQTVAQLSSQYLELRDFSEDIPHWSAPTGAHDAYPLGYVVQHADKVWDSLVALNVWEPGVSGWRERVEDGGVPVWVQPTGAHDAYASGDRVQHNDKVWASDIDGNVWEPGVFGWTEQGSA